MLTKTKDNKSRLSHKKATLEMKCRINTLPAKSLLFALSYLLSKSDGKIRSEEAVINIGKAKRSVKVLNNVVNRLRDNHELDPDEMHDVISIASASYVNLYYSLDDKIRDVILEENNATKRKSLSKETNIITMPAVMFNRKEPKNKVISRIRRSVYKKPFGFLYAIIESSRKIEAMQISMALKKPTEYGMSKLEYSISTLEKKVGEIEVGIIKPGEDEALKTELIDGLVVLAQLHNISTMSYLNWKLDEASFNMKSAQRLSRE